MWRSLASPSAAALNYGADAGEENGGYGGIAGSYTGASDGGYASLPQARPQHCLI